MHLGICDPFERLLDGAPFDESLSVLVHLALLEDALAVTERLADAAAVLLDGIALALRFDVELVDYSLWHGHIIPKHKPDVKCDFSLCEMQISDFEESAHRHETQNDRSDYEHQKDHNREYRSRTDR
jgi:hypothetical protein